MKDRLLLVEDDAYSADLTSFALKEAGISLEVDVACDGIEALDRLSRDPLPRLVFLDLNMPRMDGFETLTRLRAETRTRSLPVIIMTLSSREEDLARCFELGADDYLCKFSNLDKFTRDLRRLALHWLEMGRSVPDRRLEPLP